MLGVRLERELEIELENQVKKTGQSKSALVKQAVRDYLQKIRLEEWHDQKTLEGWRQIQEGDSVPAEEIFAYLDTWKE